MWPPNSRSVNYGLPHEMGMVGLRDVFVVAPASSFHHGHDSAALVSSDPQHIAASNAATALGVGVGLIPVLTAGPCLAGVDDADDRSRGGGIQLWQQNHQSHYLKSKSASYDYGNSGNLVQSVGCGGSGSGGVGGPTNSSTATCQDCGNQAKKDCTHRRCRTCCKSRGFDCATHVKSTWVPAARRRERQLMASASGGAVAGPGSSGATSGTKKPRLINSQTTTSHTSTSNTTPPRSFETSSSHQDASFKDGLPGQVRAPAVFKCVRVTAMDDGEDQFAYQAVVKIQGRVFKGFLYDQGAETREVFPNISELHLGGGGGSSSGGARNGASSPILDPSDVYASSGGGFLGGSGYGNQIN